MIQINYQTDSLFASRRAGDNYHSSSVSLKPRGGGAPLYGQKRFFNHSWITGSSHQLDPTVQDFKNSIYIFHFALQIPIHGGKVRLVQVYTDVQYIQFDCIKNVSECLF